MQSVNHSVSSDEYVFPKAALMKQSLPRTFSRRKIQIGNEVGNPPINFLRKRPLPITTSQPSLHVSETDPMIKCHHCRDQSGRGISLRQYPIGLDVINNRIQSAEKSTSQL